MKPLMPVTPVRSIMNVLVIDIGGTNVKILATGQQEQVKFPSGPAMTAKAMVAGVKKRTRDWKYDVISMGYPGRFFVAVQRQNRETLLRVGLVRFEAAFERPVKIINDAAMQALGSYNGGTMLFLGLGTGLGSALIVDGSVLAMELAHLPYKRGSYEDYVGIRGLEKHGKKKWRRLVADVVEILMDALRPEEVVLGGGNVKKLKELPLHCRAGDNADAFRGGFRLWEKRVTSRHLRIRIA
jgi:Transcriptional regulator/sugar kinase